MQPASMRNIIFLWHCTLILSFYCFHILHLFSCIIYFYRSQETYSMEGNQSIQAKMLTKVSALNLTIVTTDLRHYFYFLNVRPGVTYYLFHFQCLSHGSCKSMLKSICFVSSCSRSSRTTATVAEPL